MKYYKILKSGGIPCNGGNGVWFLPQGDKPGKWMPKIEGDLIPCENGYHLCRSQDLRVWFNEEIYEAEHRGEIVEASGKVVVREARLIRKLEAWNEKTARLFAVKCAKRALKIWDKYYPNDKRPHEAVRQAYLFALGKTTKEEMDAAGAAARAAGVAAWAAAWAAWAAARVAAWAAWDAGDAGDAAWAAARAAAWAAWAAWDAARAAGDAEEKWQTKTLLKMLKVKR